MGWEARQEIAIAYKKGYFDILLTGGDKEVPLRINSKIAELKDTSIVRKQRRDTRRMMKRIRTYCYVYCVWIQEKLQVKWLWMD